MHLKGWRIEGPKRIGEPLASIPFLRFQQQVSGCIGFFRVYLLGSKHGSRLNSRHLVGLFHFYCPSNVGKTIIKNKPSPILLFSKGGISHQFIWMVIIALVTWVRMFTRGHGHRWSGPSATLWDVAGFDDFLCLMFDLLPQGRAPHS